MDPEVELLLDRHIVNLVQFDLALFFHHHPDHVDTAEGLERWLARPQAELKEALDALVTTGILERVELGSGRYVVYSYTRDPYLQARVERLSAEYHQNPTARLEIVRRIMRLPAVPGAKQGGSK